MSDITRKRLEIKLIDGALYITQLGVSPIVAKGFTLSDEGVEAFRDTAISAIEHLISEAREQRISDGASL